MPKLTKSQIQRVRAIQNAITNEPRLYDQRQYCGLREDNPCKSACCLAGWAVWMSSPKKFSEMAKQENLAIENYDGSFPDWVGAANNYLGIRGHDDGLYSGSPAMHWPSPFSTDWIRASTAAEKAAVAVARLDYLIETGK